MPLGKPKGIFVFIYKLILILYHAPDRIKPITNTTLITDAKMLIIRLALA